MALMPANFDRSLSILRSKNGTVQKIIFDMHDALLEHFVVICCHVHHKIFGWSPCFANRKYAAPWNFMINTSMPTWCFLIQLISNYIQPHAGVTEDELHVPAPKGAPPNDHLLLPKMPQLVGSYNKPCAQKNPNQPTIRTVLCRWNIGLWLGQRHRPGRWVLDWLWTRGSLAAIIFPHG